ncbi:MAG: hypothetical protein KDD47_22845 [Acidobacteria bacterium]|nr:hypothetical protein [Acidobacteriota bacterium]
MAVSIERLLQGLAEGPPQPVYLVHGDLVLAEPAARRLAEAVGKAVGSPVEERRRPTGLGPILEDLQTYSLFSPAKVTLVVDSAVCADRTTAAALVDEIKAVLPVGGGEGLTGRERQAASRLLQVLRLFDLDPLAGTPDTVVGELPDWALSGGGKAAGGTARKPGKNQLATLKKELGELLAKARDEELAGWSDNDLARLGEVVHGGLPKNHCLVLAERSAAGDHPLVTSLQERGAVVASGGVAAEKRGGFRGLELLARQLEEETGASINRDALEELARRTLRQKGGWGDSDVEGSSTARLAGEYRKLATLAGGGRIDHALVASTVLDRGEEDVWKILDAVGSGNAREALGRLRRYLANGGDPIAARLSFFALLAGFCRQLTAVRGMMRLARVPAGEKSYPRFKDRHAPVLLGAPPTGGKNPLAGMHPFRLHRAYLAASRLQEGELNRLPWRVLETELLLKGEGTDADAALQGLILRLAGS